LNVTAIDTYDDHRMAMAFSLAACAEVPVTIRDPGCTRKTFPNYFDVLSTFVKNKLEEIYIESRLYFVACPWSEDIFYSFCLLGRYL
jgi:hypothetical protein